MSSNPSSTGLGAYFRHIGTERICASRLSHTTWTLDITAPGFRRAAVQELARYYVGLTGAWEHPDATMAVELPVQDTRRKGDFGELISACLFGHRLGHEVPFQKLEFMRPVRNATVQGPDIRALTLGREPTPEPVLVECKLRPVISPKAVLDELRESLERIDEDYIVSAWRAAFRIMRLHPASKKQFALSVAELLAQLSGTPGTYPVHDKQAVIVSARSSLTVAKIEEHWGDHPPVTELHVVAVHRLEEVIESLYTHASKMTYVDVASAAPHLVSGARHTPGLSAPVISDEAVKALRLSDGEASPVLLIEASLWLLADWDGMGTARARELAAKAADPQVRELARLLTGAGARARRALEHDEALGPFAQAATDTWERAVTAGQLAAATKSAAGKVDDPGLALAVRYIGAAVLHRLARHPVTMVEAAGAVGPNVHHVVHEMMRFGKQAFWPSQAAAIQGGLLDRGHPSMAIKMPTSAGKTTLVELVCADALDADVDGVAVVLAPTKALVRQLSSDLRKVLPSTVAVRSSHGGLDFDIEGPSADGLLNATGIVVVTPERFDLEWRQHVSSSDDTVIGRVRVLVVDEAHLITEMGRGPRLELILGRAIRAGIRLVLLSSQLPMGDDLAAWQPSSAAASWDAEYAAGRYAGEPPVAFTRDILAAARQAMAARGLYIGCGNGRNYLPLADGGLDLTGLDISSAAITQLAARAPDRRHRLICGDLSALPAAAAYPLVIGIRVFQHGDRAAAHAHIRAAQQRVSPGGLFCLRVNATATDVWPRHEVTEHDPGGGFTVRYLTGPKQGLHIRFTSAELGRLLGRLHRDLAAVPAAGPPDTFPRILEMPADPAWQHHGAVDDPGLTGLIRRKLAEVRAAARSAASGRPGVQLVHGDWHDGNILYQGGTVSGIRDFDFAHPDLPLVDLAIAALIPDVEDSAQIAVGYFDARSPAEHALDLIATAQRARALGHVAYFIHRYVDGDHGALDQIRRGVDLLLRAEQRWPALRAAILSGTTG